MTSDVPVRVAVRRVADTLSGTGTASPLAEAEILVAHVAGVERHRLHSSADLGPEAIDVLDTLVRRRAATGEPVQYLVGHAVSGRLDLEVGPGVFIPRPETELLVAAALDALPPVTPGERPVVVDLCAGSGTLALEIAHARPDADVHAVELHDDALLWLRRNVSARAGAGDTPVTVHHADATAPDLLCELEGIVDVVVSNPPYVPDGAEIPEEVAAHEPATALFGGEDGLAVIRPLVGVAARLLRPGGTLGVEHDDSTGGAVAAVIVGHGGFGTVERHADLAGRPRHVTARRRGGGTPGPAPTERGHDR